jgi:hypothetical protein
MPSEITNLPRDTTLQEIARILETIAAILAAGESGVENWAKGINLIRQGLGPKFFPTGANVNVAHTGYGNGSISVQAIGNDIMPDATGLRQHTLTLLMRNCIPNISIGREQLLWANTGTGPLPAATNSFTLYKGDLKATRPRMAHTNSQRRKPSLPVVDGGIAQ